VTLPASIIADDLSGAAEMASIIARRERPARIAWWNAGDAAAPAAAPAADVIDTESRHLDDATAAARLHAALTGTVGAAERLVYKKIDSTLRGPIRAELAALHAAQAGASLLLAPAYPAMGRVTRGGIQVVDGVAVHASRYADDPHGGPKAATLAALLPAGHVTLLPPPHDPLTAWLQRLRDALQRGHVIIDAEEERDLATLAVALRRAPHSPLIGSAGLARHLLGSVDAAAIRPLGPRPTSIWWLIGSAHPNGRAQLTHLPTPPAGVRWRVITTPPERMPAAEANAFLQRALRDAAAAETPPQAVIASGGETALLALTQHHAHGFAVGGELLPGMPWGEVIGGAWDGVLLVTKAGGFGSRDVLAQAWERLRLAR
jgi:D-threonate/D-erythronate kinase